MILAMWKMTGRQTCLAKHCEIICHQWQLFCLCHVTLACPRYLPTPLAYHSLLISLLLPIPMLLPSSQPLFNHSYSYKIWLEGKCFYVKVCLLWGFPFSFDLIFPNNSLGEITLDGGLIPPRNKHFGSQGWGREGVIDGVFVYPCCPKTS